MNVIHTINKIKKVRKRQQSQSRKIEEEQKTRGRTPVTLNQLNYKLHIIEKKLDALQKILHETLEAIFEEEEDGTEVSSQLEGLDVSDSEESSSSER